MIHGTNIIFAESDLCFVVRNTSGFKKNFTMDRMILWIIFFSLDSMIPVMYDNKTKCLTHISTPIYSLFKI